MSRSLAGRSWGSCIVGAPELALAAGLAAAPLRELWRASRYATNAGRPVEEFAIGVARLLFLGLSECDVRWLWCKGFVQQAAATTRKIARRAAFGGPLLELAPQSAFVLTPHGIELLEQLLARSDSQAEGNSAAGRQVPWGQTPCWDPQLRELSVDQILIKRFCVPAENQELILAAFQEEAWPLRIDDPLPPVPEITAKRRLHSTIQCLNRNQRTHLLHFRGDGNGCGVRWELLSAAPGRA